MTSPRSGRAGHYAAFFQDRHDVLMGQIEDDPESAAAAVDYERGISKNLRQRSLRVIENHPPSGPGERVAAVECDRIKRNERCRPAAEAVKELFTLRQSDCEIAHAHWLGALWAGSEEHVGKLGDERRNVAGVDVLFVGLEKEFNGCNGVCHLDPPIHRA